MIAEGNDRVWSAAAGSRTPDRGTILPVAAALGNVKVGRNRSFAEPRRAFLPSPGLRTIRKVAFGSPVGLSRHSFIGAVRVASRLIWHESLAKAAFAPSRFPRFASFANKRVASLSRSNAGTESRAALWLVTGALSRFPRFTWRGLCRSGSACQRCAWHGRPAWHRCPSPRRYPGPAGRGSRDRRAGRLRARGRALRPGPLPPAA